MKKQTQAIHVPYVRRDAFDALSMPVYNAVAYEFDNARVMSDAFCNRIDAPDYGRCENPTTRYFEERVRTVTGAKAVVALNSGMAAISNTLLALASQGKNIVTSRHLFGNSFSLLSCTLRRFGVEPRFVDLTDEDEVERSIDADTCCLFMEILTNPQMEVADIRMLARLAHDRYIPLVADTTTIPFTKFNARSLGVDIEVVSSTKYISGGATSLGGLVIDHGTTHGFADRMKNEMLFNLGAYMNPQVAFMQTTGLETLDARYRVQSSNALELAGRMQLLPQVCRVNYVGLPDNPYYELAQAQFGGTAGAMICIELTDRQACFDFIDNLKLIHRATNLFDNRTLAIHPASTIFGNFTAAERESMDICDTTVRISVGLEDVDDLFEDIRQALQ